MNPPIILIEGDDILFFRSIQAAEGYIEPIDARNREYACFDSDGEFLEAEVYMKTVPVLGGLLRPDREHVRLRRADEGNTALLRNGLLRLLKRHNSFSPELEHASVRTLVDRAVQCLGFTA